MEKDLLKIIEHFGINNQQRKLKEEVFELQEAIIKREAVAGYEQEYLEEHKNHIAEEIVDVMILLEQFYYYYGLDQETLLKIEEEKLERTLQRIESGYYEK